jgi:hypothetical protein
MRNDDRGRHDKQDYDAHDHAETSQDILPTHGTDHYAQTQNDKSA